jgi:hypothetical protein
VAWRRQTCQTLRARQEIPDLLLVLDKLFRQSHRNLFAIVLCVLDCRPLLRCRPHYEASAFTR